MHAAVRWFARRTWLAYSLKTLSPWNFIINRQPLQATLVLMMISPGAFIFLNWAVRGEWIPFSYQWYSARIGDVLLAILGGFYVWWLRGSYVRRRLFRRRLWHYVIVIAWYGVAFLHMWQERGSVDTWERRLGANAVYHTVVVYPLIGYTLTVLFIASLKFAPPTAWNRVMRVILVTVVLVGGWALLGVYDGAHQFAPNGVSKHVYSSPEDGWRNVRLLLEWITRFG